MLLKVQVVLSCINDLSLNSQVCSHLLCCNYSGTAWVEVEETFVTSLLGAPLLVR